MGRTGPVTKDTSTVALGLAQIRVGSAAANITSKTSVLTADQSIGALASTKYTGEVSYWKLESGFPLLEDMTLPLRETAMLECGFKEISPKNLAIARGLDPSSGAGTLSVSGMQAVKSTNALTMVPAGITLDPTYAKLGTYTIEFSSSTAYELRHSTEGTLVGDGTQALGTVEAFSFDGVNDAVTLSAAFVTGTVAGGDVITFQVINVSSDFADNHTGEIGLGAIKAPEFVRMEAVYTYPNGTNHMYVIFPRANVVSSVDLDMQAEDAMTVPITFEAKRADSEVVGGNAVWDQAPLGVVLFD